MGWQKRGERPTLKQKLFAQKYVEYKGNGTRAALDVYDSDYVGSKTIATKNLKKEIVKKEIEKVLEKSGLSINTLARYSKEYIDKSIEAKPNFQTGAEMIKFLFKVHNVLPASKHLNLAYSRKEITNQDFVSLKNNVTELNNKLNTLLEELK